MFQNSEWIISCNEILLTQGKNALIFKSRALAKALDIAALIVRTRYV